MNLRFNQKQWFFSGLLLIALLYSLYNIRFDLTYVPGIPGKLKHFNKLVWVLLVYGTGTWVLKRSLESWLIQLWHLVYLLGLLVLILIGLYDWHQGLISPALRNIANTIHKFLLSPVLFAALGLLRWRLAKEI